MGSKNEGREKMKEKKAITRINYVYLLPKMNVNM